MSVSPGLFTVAHNALIPPRSRSVRLWNAEILKGHGAYLHEIDDFQEHPWLGSPWLGEVPADELLARLAVVVQDLSGIGGSGWIVQGGPVSRITLSTDVTLYLYGREIDRSHAGIFNNAIDPQESTYDFLLLRRNEINGEAQILRQWTSSANERSTGSMRYIPERDQISVHITGIHPVTEFMSMSTLLR